LVVRSVGGAGSGGVGVGRQDGEGSRGSNRGVPFAIGGWWD
jgi:hypothetical protein